jgi:hypothetical protein
LKFQYNQSIEQAIRQVKAMNAIAEKIFAAIKTLPEQQAAEVLDFAEFLQAKRTQGAPGATPFKDEEMTVSPEEHAAWVEQMRAITAVQPMTYTTVEDLRREARY